MSIRNLFAALFVALALKSLTISAASLRHGARSQCSNSASNRQCWDGVYDVGTDVDQEYPVTGKTVTYDIEITNTTCDPDGSGNVKPCMLMNGQYPGPTIRANWGDSVVVNVKNSLQHNGTSLHWHGVRQYMTNDMDGTNGLTECPLAPGYSKTYVFDATQHGTSWYHSHYSPQYGDGIAGPLIFDGPTTANYDIDLGAYPISDWMYQSSWQVEYLTEVAFQSGGKDNAVMNNILINGTNKNPQGTGKYSTTTIQPGKRYLLRLISMTADNFVQVTLDGHQFEVVAADFIPIKPITANWLLLGSGQRYDVIITANQSAGNFWFRAEPATVCGSSNDFYGRAIWSYSDVKAKTPTSTPLSPVPATCKEPAPLTPFWHRPTSKDSFSQNVGTLEIDSTLNPPLVDDFDIPGDSKILLWTLDPSTGTTMNVNWSNPTLSYIMNNNTNYPKELQLIPTAQDGATNFWVIQQPANSAAVAHPMHLHGHDFAVLGQGTGKFDASSATLNFDTPTRRDTVTVYAGADGTWTVIAFLSNNPGAWILHCHIAWHVSGGLGVQFLESPGKIPMHNREQYQDQCLKYRTYSATALYPKDDSGL